MVVLVISAVCIALLGAVLWTIRKSRRTHILITIRGDRELEVDRGGNLLDTLAKEGIQLPSTCGGKGSCALCRCRVIKGGGPISDRETPFFSPAEIRTRWRLACQVLVQRDLLIEIPEPGQLPRPKVPLDR